MKESVERAADSKAGKWVSMAGIVASLVTGAVNFQSNYYHHKETMRQLEDAKRQITENRIAVDYLGGTGVVKEAVEAVKQQTEATK